MKKGIVQKRGETTYIVQDRKHDSYLLKPNTPHESLPLYFLPWNKIVPNWTFQKTSSNF